MSRKMLRTHVRSGDLVRVCHGVYALSPPDVVGTLRALDLMVGRQMVACLGTAAHLHGFDTERSPRVHVLDPGVRVRPTAGVMVHQRVGAALSKVDERLATAPAWTAVEVACSLRRPRALATLDAALHVGACTTPELEMAAREQTGRRGIVHVRELLPHADCRAESPMESEARLVFIDHGLPTPQLQYEIVDQCGDLWRVDFAWPEHMVVAEYDSMEWHANPKIWKRDRLKVERLKDCGWTTVPMVVDDVRLHARPLVNRIERLLA
ncbi:type IV toxin-antitoxin system AbiEi family antitoxin domain-containing protein [Mycobacterium hodleri]|nr:type IV toxin-antitoxin system AbiEi family antitoxin domain-containing protein [Mycolicibacterium hodleri]